MSDEVAFEVCQVRGALEGFAARTSCRTLTDSQLRYLRELALGMGTCVRSGDIFRLAEVDIEFHSIICEAVPNRRLINQWSVHNALHGALMVSILERHHMDAQDVIDLHLQVCAALETRDPATAEAAIRSHYMGSDWDTLHPSVSQAV
jgi:DNA-binding GntR family transcriptional regulator